jgi:hypothetical protein
VTELDGRLTQTEKTVVHGTNYLNVMAESGENVQSRIKSGIEPARYQNVTGAIEGAGSGAFFSWLRISTRQMALHWKILALKDCIGKTIQETLRLQLLDSRPIQKEIIVWELAWRLSVGLAAECKIFTRNKTIRKDTKASRSDVSFWCHHYRRLRYPYCLCPCLCQLS